MRCFDRPHFLSWCKIEVLPVCGFFPQFPQISNPKRIRDPNGRSDARCAGSQLVALVGICRNVAHGCHLRLCHFFALASSFQFSIHITTPR